MLSRECIENNETLVKYYVSQLIFYTVILQNLLRVGGYNAYKLMMKQITFQISNSRIRIL